MGERIADPVELRVALDRDDVARVVQNRRNQTEEQHDPESREPLAMHRFVHRPSRLDRSI
jgi:hypothetical protein